MNTTVLVPDGDKIRKARGDYSRAVIVRRAAAKGYNLTEMNLYTWEIKRNRPKPENIPALLAGLNVTFEEIASPINSDN